MKATTFEKAKTCPVCQSGIAHMEFVHKKQHLIKCAETTSQILGEGTVECVYEPRGIFGMEGYSRGDRYKYQMVKDDVRGKYFRLWPSMESPEYYETCSMFAFNRCFDNPK